VLALTDELNDTISGFLRGQGTICLVLAIYYALALWLIGLNHGILIGIAAGLISFIPYLGSLTGLVLSLYVSCSSFGRAGR
jgi:predicted PurR-regulated permease PerM